MNEADKSVPEEAVSLFRALSNLAEIAGRHATKGLLALALSGYVWFFVDRATLLGHRELKRLRIEDMN